MPGTEGVRLRETWRRLRQRRFCQAAASAVLHSTARIDNNLPDAGAIRIGEHTHVRGQLLTFGHGGRIVLGDYCYLGEDSRLWSAASIDVGDRVLISHNVNIFDNLTHPLSARARHEQFKAIISRGQPVDISLGEKPVIIEDDVLIGCMCVILPGVRIGRGAIVGAGSVVTRDVPGYSIVAGNPATVLRELGPDER